MFLVQGFIPHATLCDWKMSVCYSRCLLFAAQRASQMASLKVLIDAQCLLIKKLLLLMTRQQRQQQQQRTHTPKDNNCGGGFKKKIINRKTSSISVEDKVTRHVVLKRSLLLHGRWKTAAGMKEGSGLEASRPLFSMQVVWCSHDFFFFLFYPLDSCFDIDHDTILCSVFSLIRSWALRCTAVKQQGCWRLTLISLSHVLLSII